MFSKIFKFILILLLFYQTSSFSKSISFDNFNSKDLSNYFSGIVAFENKSNSKALKFFNSSKNLIKDHDPYLKKYVKTLVLEQKVSEAIIVIKKNKNKSNSNFFDAHLLLILDSLKRNDIEKAYEDLKIASNFVGQDRLNSAILETLKQYVFVFKEKKLISSKKNFGNFTRICFRLCRNS